MVANSSSANEQGGIKTHDPYGLREDEEWWRDQYEMLLKHGYELRPRFRPGWTPSWTVKKKAPEFCEDGYANTHPKTIDARRLSDGKRVMIKKLFKGSKEVEIALFLSSNQLLKDPRNHCVPVLEVFSEEGDPVEFMVMPLLITYMRPPFSSVGEVVDFMRQTLEGLLFMHEHGVAHRDCSVLNIMMDGEPIYPKGFHPSMPLLDASGKSASPRKRRDVSRVVYYFTDFGISSRFDKAEESRLVTGEDGQDQNVPEIHGSEPYDPFPVDVFILGNLFRKQFVQNYENLSFLEPLVEKMTQQDSKTRPTAQEALQLFGNLVEEQAPRSLRWNLAHYGSGRFRRLLRTTDSVVREVALLASTFLSSSGNRK